MKKWAYLFSATIFSVFFVQFAGCATPKSAPKKSPPATSSEATDEKKITETKKTEEPKTKSTISNIDELISAASTDGAHIIIECPIDLGGQSISLADGTFIEGEDGATIFNGELRTVAAQNIKLESLTFWGCPVIFSGECKSVRITNCTFSSDENGILSALMILQGVGIEVFQCEFIGDEKNNEPLAIFGSREITASECQIQLHHSRFSGNAAIFAKASMIHLYDCDFLYPEGENAQFFLGLGTASQIIAESCGFFSDENPVVCYSDVSATPYAGTFSRIFQNKCRPEITEKMCIYDNTDALKSFKSHLASKKMWEIPYKYVLEDINQSDKKIGH